MCCHSWVTTTSTAVAAPGEDWEGTVPPLLSKVIFVNRLDPLRKELGVIGGDVINHIGIFAGISVYHDENFSIKTLVLLSLFIFVRIPTVLSGNLIVQFHTIEYIFEMYAQDQSLYYVIKKLL